MDKLEFRLFDGVAAGEEWLLRDGAVNEPVMLTGIYINGREIADILDEAEDNDEPAYGHIPPSVLLEELDNVHVVTDKDEIQFQSDDLSSWQASEEIRSEEGKQEYGDYLLTGFENDSTILCCRGCGCTGCYDAEVRIIKKGGTVIWCFADIRGRSGLCFEFDEKEYERAVERLKTFCIS